MSQKNFKNNTQNEPNRFVQPSQSLLEKHLNPSLLKDLRPEYRRRLEIVLRTNMGQSQSEICAAVGCSEDTARYWMAMAETGQAYEMLDRPFGRPKRVNVEYLQRLQELVNANPQKYGYSFKYWTAHWLGKHLSKELGIEVSDRHINRLLKQMGLSTRPKNQQKVVNQKPWQKGITIDDLYPPANS